MTPSPLWRYFNFFGKERLCEDCEFRALRIGPLHADRDSVALHFGKNIIYSVCLSWPNHAIDNLIVGDTAHWRSSDGGEVLNLGPGKRLEWTIWPFGHWLLGLEKKNRFQKWTFAEGFRSKEKTYLQWSPPRSWMCQNKTGVLNRRGEATEICGGFRWHQCPYERCDCGETTIQDCAERPSRHCGSFND